LGAAGTATTIAAGRSRCSALHRGAHARARGQTVIHHDHYLARDLGERPTFPAGLFPAQQLAALPLGDLPDDLRRNAQAAGHVVV
jgi:hypothetical protein